jgi:hypothetical protein
MPLLNYTTKVPVGRTLGEMQQKLAKAGARGVMIEYDEFGEAAGLSFKIETSFGMQGFTLPVDVAACYKVMERERVSGLDDARAARVAWRILKDWLEAQLALIETQMVTLDQVMLPYMRAEGGGTVYDAIVGGRLALSAGDSS